MAKNPWKIEGYTGGPQVMCLRPCSQETVEALTKERDELKAELATATRRLSLYSATATQDEIRLREAEQHTAVLRAYESEISLQSAEIDRYETVLRRLQNWANAYPLNIFPKPDLEKAHEVLKVAGLSLDAISADNMRYVLDSIKDIVEQALQGESCALEKERDTLRDTIKQMRQICRTLPYEWGLLVEELAKKALGEE